MFRKVAWLIALLAIAALGRFGLEQVAGSVLHTAAVLVETGDYDGARHQLDRLDGWLAWTDAAKKAPELRLKMDAKMAEERRRVEAERQQRELERAQEASTAQSGSQGDRGSGVYMPLNRAESLRRKKR